MDDELTRLPRELEPSPELHERIVTQLGLRKQRRGLMFLVAAACIIAGFAAGLLMPHHERAQTARGREFILFVHDTPSMQTDGNEPRRIDEYRRWAQELRSRGTLEGGDKLTDDITAIGPASGNNNIGGFFRIVARDRAEAERVARSCPHLKYGGWIELREIDHV